MTAHEVLVKARNLIADEKDWCGHDALGPNGEICAMVALKRAAEGFEWCNGREALKAANGFTNVAYFNDSHSHAEVLAAFDRAIAATAPKPDLSFLKDVRVEPVAAVA